MRSSSPATVAAIVLACGLAVSPAAHALPAAAAVPMWLTVTSTATIGEVDGREVDTRLDVPGFGATAGVAVTPTGAVGPVTATAFVSPFADHAGSYVQTGSTVQFPIALTTSLDAILASLDRHGPAQSQSFVTATQVYFDYAGRPSADYGFQNLVFTTERTNAACRDNRCDGFDEVVQITVPGVSPSSAAAVAASDMAAVEAMLAAAEAGNLPITFSAYARDYSLVQGPAAAGAGAASLPYFTALSGIAYSGTVSAVPEPSTAALFAGALLLGGLCLRHVANRRAVSAPACD